MFEKLKQRLDQHSGYIFIAPQMILILFFILIPVVEGFRLAAYSSYGRRSVYVGFENFKNLLQDDVFRQAVINTIIFVIAIVFLTIVFGLFVSSAVFDKSQKYVSFIRTSYYLPVMVSMLVMSIIWKILLNPANGPVTWLLEQMGFHDVNLLGNEKTVMPVIIFVTFIGNVGQAILIYLATMIGIPQDYFEAAELDGASRFQKIRHIIVPLVRPTTRYLVITNIVAVLKMFVVIEQLTGGGPNNRSVTIMYYLYQNAFEYSDMGTAAAIGVIMFLIALAFSIPQIRSYLKEAK